MSTVHKRCWIQQIDKLEDANRSHGANANYGPWDRESCPAGSKQTTGSADRS
jgi:hypothetical protein